MLALPRLAGTISLHITLLISSTAFAQARSIDPAALQQLRRDNQEEEAAEHAAIGGVVNGEPSESQSEDPDVNNAATDAPGESSSPVTDDPTFGTVVGPTLGVRDAAEGQAADAAAQNGWTFDPRNPDVIGGIESLREVEGRTEGIAEQADDAISQALAESDPGPVADQPTIEASTVPANGLPKWNTDEIRNNFNALETVQEAQEILNQLNQLQGADPGLELQTGPGVRPPEFTRSEDLLNNLNQLWDGAEYQQNKDLVDAVGAGTTPTLQDLQQIMDVVARAGELNSRILDHNNQLPAVPDRELSEDEYNYWFPIVEAYNAEADALNYEQSILLMELGGTDLPETTEPFQ